jgi:hypothetical protein
MSETLPVEAPLDALPQLNYRCNTARPHQHQRLYNPILSWYQILAGDLALAGVHCCHVLCSPTPLQGIIICWCHEFKPVSFKIFIETTKRCEFSHFLSLLITFCHVLSLFDQRLGGVTSMFCAHQCLNKASCCDTQHFSITDLIKTTQMLLVTDSDFPTMSLLKTKLKCD